jgi:hypothetical protein
MAPRSLLTAELRRGFSSITIKARHAGAFLGFAVLAALLFFDFFILEVHRVFSKTWTTFEKAP